MPNPVISIAVEPLSRDDQKSLSTALQKLSEEDPTFQALHRHMLLRGQQQDKNESYPQNQLIQNLENRQDWEQQVYCNR